MKIVSYLEKLEQLPSLKENGVEEVILGAQEFSRYGKIKLENLNLWAKEIRKNGILPVLEWDILMTENVFAETVKALDKVDLSLFHSVRVQDPGAIYYIKNHSAKNKIQLILETGNHNLQGILDWANYLENCLDRIVLSIELPYETLKMYTTELHARNIKTELLGLGRILLFYTPRSLLAPVVFDHDDDKMKMMIDSENFERLASSEESPHKGFPILETKHGTFMFHIKEHCLLTQVPKLFEMNLDYLRVDLRFGKPISLFTQITEVINNFTEEKAQNFKQSYPSDTMLGFFNINKTDTLFKKLKNQKLQRQDQNYLGDVYEISKDKHIAFMNRSQKPITPEMNIKIINPEGKEILTTIGWLKNSKLEQTQSIPQGELALINYMGKVQARSQVYLV